MGAITSIAHEAAVRLGRPTAISNDNGTRLPLTLQNAYLRDNLRGNREPGRPDAYPRGDPTTDAAASG